MKAGMVLAAILTLLVCACGADPTSALLSIEGRCAGSAADGPEAGATAPGPVLPPSAAIGEATGTTAGSPGGPAAGGSPFRTPISAAEPLPPPFPGSGFGSYSRDCDLLEDPYGTCL